MPETHDKENRFLLLKYWLKKSRYDHVMSSSVVCRSSLRHVSALLNTEAGHDFRHSGSVNVCLWVLLFFQLTAFNSVEQFSLSADWSSPGRHGNVSWTEPRAWRTASCQIIVFKFNNQTSHHRRGFYISVKDWCSVTWLNNTWKILVNRRAIHLFQIYYIIRFYSDESWMFLSVICWFCCAAW